MTDCGERVVGLRGGVAFGRLESDGLRGESMELRSPAAVISGISTPGRGYGFTYARCCVGGRAASLRQDFFIYLALIHLSM